MPDPQEPLDAGVAEANARLRERITRESDDLTSDRVMNILFPSISAADADRWTEEAEQDRARDAENRILIASLDEGTARPFLQSATEATGAIPAVAHLFTIAETAQIIGESYHTTRNKALRGDFGTILRGDHDNPNPAPTYIQREGLLQYLYDEIVETREKHNDLLQRQAEMGGAYVSPSAFHERAIVDERHDEEDYDTTDETANLAQAFENVSQAFTALLADRGAERDRMNAVVEQLTSLRHSVERIQSVPSSEQVARYMNQIDNRLRHMEERQQQQHAAEPRLHIPVTANAGTAASPFNTVPRYDFPAFRERVTSPATSAPPPSTAPPESVHPPVESAATPAVASVTLIPDDRPDQIVIVAPRSGIHDRRDRRPFRTRQAISVGELVVVENGDIRPVTAGDPIQQVAGVVLEVRDARPDASEVQRAQGFGMNWNSTREILHPFRGTTFRMSCDQTGHPSIPEGSHATIVHFDADVITRRTSILWRAS